VLVEAGCDRAVMLDLVEEPLDEVAALVGARTECGRVGAMVERPDVCGRTLGGDHGAQSIAVVAAVSEYDTLARQCREHILGALAVVRLPPGKL